MEQILVSHVQKIKNLKMKLYVPYRITNTLTHGFSQKLKECQHGAYTIKRYIFVVS